MPFFPIVNAAVLKKIADNNSSSGNITVQKVDYTDQGDGQFLWKVYVNSKAVMENGRLVYVKGKDEQSAIFNYKNSRYYSR